MTAPRRSVLFGSAAPPDRGGLGQPSCFPDLNLDRVVAAITAGREEYDLAPFFHAPLRDPELVRYRQAVFRDLEKTGLRRAIVGFAEGMRRMRQRLDVVRRLRYTRQRQRWFLDAVQEYCNAVDSLTSSHNRIDPESSALRGFRDEMDAYTRSPRFGELQRGARQLVEELGEVVYSVHVRGSRVTVGTYEGEPDYSEQVAAVFSKFRQGMTESHLAKLPDDPVMNHVEARILDLVARQHAELFSRLDAYCERWLEFVDPSVAAFDREIQMYLAYLEFTERVARDGLVFRLPDVQVSSNEVWARDAFDVALASTSAAGAGPVVVNDFHLRRPERVLVVTGPNQGGKTTFARMFGQLHYLASLGLPVPAAEARLELPDRVFTHFEREESLSTLRGKLDDELVRLHDILEEATSDSVIVMNESFTSTTLRDALLLGTEMLGRVVGLGALCVYVTFVDELASQGDAVVSMVATVHPDDPTTRTFRILRMPADGLAYAMAIAEKYGLTYESVVERLGS